MRRSLLLALLALWPSYALAHTQVTRQLPPAGSTVTAPAAIRLELSEAINLHFSTFKVYPLPAGQSAQGYAAAMLGTNNCDALRADTCPKLDGLAARVSIPLKSNLKAGPYVLMWRILSDDGHVVSGQSSFSIK